MVRYRRWYDDDPKLKKVIETFEHLNGDVQLKFAAKFLEMSERLLSQLGGHEYLATLEMPKQEAMQKSSARKRWYDRHESLFKAFNNIYALNSYKRRELADMMTLPIQIVQGYERHCKEMGKPPDLKVIEEVLRSCFQEGAERTKKLYAVYLPEFDAEMKHHHSRMKQHEPKGMWQVFIESLQKAIG